MRLLGRDEILAAKDTLPETVDCTPEWPGSVLVRGGSSAERDEFESSIIVGRGDSREVNTKRLRAKLVSMSLVDEAGARLFSEADVEQLAKKSARVIDKLFKISQRLWGLTANDVSSLVGESQPGRNAEPGTDTPGNGVTPALVTSNTN